MKILYLWCCLLGIFTAYGQDTSNYPNQDTNYTKAQIQDFITKYTQQNDYRGLAFTYLAFAKNQERWNLADESPVESYRKSMDYFRVMGDSLNYYEVTGAMGTYFMERPFFHKYAREYLEKTVNYFKKTKNTKAEIGHLINLANMAIRDNNTPKVYQSLERANFLNQNINDLLMQGRIDAAYADLYRNEKKYALSILMGKKSLQVGQTLKIAWLEAFSHYEIGIAALELGQFDFSLSNLLACLSITEANYSLNQLKRAVYEELSRYYLLKKDYKKAYEYTNMIKVTAELIYNSKVESDIRSFREYQLLEKQKIELDKIALEKKLAESALQTLRSRQQLYILSILLALALIGILAYAYLARRRFNRLQEEEVSKNLHIETLHALINGQELERLRISQELHDGLGTLLSRVKILMDSQSMNVDKIQLMIDEACSEVRNISGNLQPNTLEKFGLVRAIQDLVLKQHSGLPVIIFQYFGESFDIPSEKNLMIYRIIQELLTNALKYAQAQEVLVQIIFQDQNQITLTVEDDGIGFDETKIEAHNSGWSNIRSRVSFMQGSINLHSDSRSGTSVTIHIPFFQ
jgi:signal transduction histidine kinase